MQNRHEAKGPSLAALLRDLRRGLAADEPVLCDCDCDGPHPEGT
jgi:hypothetical protein